MRTQVFLRGVFLAIQDQLKNQNSIRILYAAGTANTYIEGPSSGSIAISTSGSSSSHENRSPYIVARHIISLSGGYPSRN